MITVSMSNESFVNSTPRVYIKLPLWTTKTFIKIQLMPFMKVDIAVQEKTLPVRRLEVRGQK
jgi:hypothetical protein